MKLLTAIATAALLTACGGGAPVAIHAVPSKAQANWNVGFSEVQAIVDACYPSVNDVVFTDVVSGVAHLYIGATPTASPPYHVGGTDVGDPLVIFNNLPNCPQAPQAEPAA